MKHLLVLTTVLALLCFSAYGETKKEVPAVVKEAFAKKFPTAKDVKWDKENDKEWGVEFELAGKELSANFDNAGLWTETGYELESKEVPAVVNAAITKDFAGYKIEDVAMSESKDSKVYEFVLEKGKDKLEVDVSPDGRILKKGKKTDEDGENDDGEDGEDGEENDD
ncbi:MAG: PepSY-like domain-containing protein [Candidatus Delongbacteria bacterium]|nr:PepSY-like domain-containing protein [Candidatus Delongbacteria bacterium]MDD4204495.1 PepSY-like domain-containing protein [Candidatus Delongbacteria bacterium]